MSALSEDARNELAAVVPRRPCDRIAELSALFHSAGRVHLLGRGEIAVHLDVASSSVARRAFTLLRGFGVHAEIRTYRTRAFDRPTRYQLHAAGSGRALQVLNEAGVLTAALAPLERPPRRVVSRACCRGAYVRGAFLGAGSLSGPESPHLEFRCTSREGADFIAALGREEGLALGVHERRRDVVAYAKGGETIASLLAIAGASDTVLVFEERSVVSSTKARANRLANADHANLVRASRAAYPQIQAVGRLARRGQLDELSPRLRELADLRVRHPTLSLRELALKCRPPATKAAVQRGLRKLLELGKP